MALAQQQVRLEQAVARNFALPFALYRFITVELDDCSMSPSQAIRLSRRRRWRRLRGCVGVVGGANALSPGYFVMMHAAGPGQACKPSSLWLYSQSCLDHANPFSRARASSCVKADGCRHSSSSSSINNTRPPIVHTSFNVPKTTPTAAISAKLDSIRSNLASIPCNSLQIATSHLQQTLVI